MTTTQYTTTGLLLDDADVAALARLERHFGHRVPPPSSQTMAEDLLMEPTPDIRREWAEYAAHVHDVRKVFDGEGRA